uniref:Nonstructural protein n=2 Tax=unclassified Microvirus TaxID=338099 RepID=A0AAU8AWJ1_9VIRU
MILGIYSIRDKKTGYLTPTVDQNDAAAKRNFEHAMMQESNLLFSHPEDYALYRIGDFNSDTGFIVPRDPELIIDGFGYGRGDE